MAGGPILLPHIPPIRVVGLQPWLHMVLHGLQVLPGPRQEPLGLHSLAVWPDNTKHYHVGRVFGAVNWRHLYHMEGQEPVCLALPCLVDGEDLLDAHLGMEEIHDHLPVMLLHLASQSDTSQLTSLNNIFLICLLLHPQQVWAQSDKR